MASQQITDKLKEEVICPICIDVLQDPVTIDCGHNFCLRCISQSGKASDNVLKCPFCNKLVRRDMFRPNWLLMNLVEKIQAMDPSETQPEREELRCLRHGEKFHYFCEHDGKFLCMVCRESKNHKLHNVTLIEEAAQSYQGQLQSKVEVLQQKEKMIVQLKEQGEQKINVFMAQAELEKQKIITEFKQLRQVLKEEENFLLSRLNWLSQEGEKGKKLYITSAEAQLNSLRKFIDSLKVKQHSPPSQLLRDVKTVLYRSDGFPYLSLTPVPLVLEKKLSEAQSRHESLTESLKRFKDNIQADRKKDKSKFLKGMNENNRTSCNRITKPASPNPRAATPFQPLAEGFLAGKATPPALLQRRSRASFAGFLLNQARSENPRSPGAERTEERKVALTPLTLDEASAHPDLVISQDLKTVTLDFIPQNSAEPADPARFFPFRCVLASPGLSSGRQAWEAELRGPEGGACLVGVASELVPRRGFLVVGPLTGFWALRIAGSECQALTETGAREDLTVRPTKVGVRVDHECGEVVFYDATTSKHIYTFHTSFPGQIFPFFRLLFPGTQITLNP
ncbi:PREDICTED: E3 ubiquitin-protein ligase TRIM31 [Ceratotherium simum simum]|uniref:E3 ubiquitin-protein ligase TRIM31 n=1 Tax=Ceratotherium simum simum TaxID=73337 RepID=A0ABM0I752_CERSS|nr:PREDICTED: E3 ubiquitin-protein ligase TRIM31 [Ceratotherium simum simum]